MEWDRKKALQEARPGDCVLIAGKGHENYQIQGDKKKPFSDFSAVRQKLRETGMSYTGESLNQTGIIPKA